MYMLQKIYDIFPVPVYVVRDGKEIYALPEGEGYQSSFVCDRDLLDELYAAADAHEGPFIYLEDEIVYYGGFKDDSERVFLFGPMTRKSMDGILAEGYWYAHKVRIKTRLERCDIGTVSKMLAMVFYHYTGRKVAYQDIELDSRSDVAREWNTEQDVENYQLEQPEGGRGHDSIEYERRILQIVQNGDVDAMKELVHGERFDMNHVGIVAVNDLKRTEYLVVSLITLIVRAAIDGGLNPEKAYEMSDVYLQQIEKCRNTSEINVIGLKAQFDITAQVNEARNKRSGFIYIEECKDYIAKHLRKPFKVGEIADAIGINRTYLAKRFSEVEGITIQQYVMKERCIHAANLLKYSDYPISIISEFLPPGPHHLWI